MKHFVCITSPLASRLSMGKTFPWHIAQTSVSGVPNCIEGKRRRDRLVSTLKLDKQPLQSINQLIAQSIYLSNSPIPNQYPGRSTAQKLLHHRVDTAIDITPSQTLHLATTDFWQVSSSANRGLSPVGRPSRTKFLYSRHDKRARAFYKPERRKSRGRKEKNRLVPRRENFRSPQSKSPSEHGILVSVCGCEFRFEFRSANHSSLEVRFSSGANHG